MLMLDQQLHGYRHGHQLLSTSTVLPKVDQELIDRLSDIAGPLSPGEQFEPYLTCYPIPSGSHYVVARTWQDLEAPRAGCVRTRSLLVPMAGWTSTTNVVCLVRVVTDLGFSALATTVAVGVSLPEPLPLVDELRGIELLEAVFLEDREPIVVFDSEQTELIAIRLLTVFWPGLRRHFSVSTFARSPRMIQKHSFDLVFAPRNSRSRFSAWKGRRIDGRKAGEKRHRWSASIVEKVFLSPIPSLSGFDALGEMSADVQGSESALRISLFWDELQSKLATSPNAALGLLDIANTRQTRNTEVIESLGPALVNSVQLATKTMTSRDAWQFLTAMLDKLRNQPLAKSVAKSIRDSAADLAAAQPEDAVKILPDLLSSGERELLSGAAGDGLARVLHHGAASHLSQLTEYNLFELLMASPILMERVLTDYPEFSTAVSIAVESSNESLRAESQRRMLRFIVDENHVDLARVLFSNLDTPLLVKEVQHLHEINRLASDGLRKLIVRRAKQVGGSLEVRNAAAALGEDKGTSAVVEALVGPNSDDLDWVLGSRHLNEQRRFAMVAELVIRANQDELRSMLADEVTLKNTLNILLDRTKPPGDVLLKVAKYIQLSSETLVDLAISIIPRLNHDAASGYFAQRAFEALLPRDLGKFRNRSMDDLMSAMGDELKVEWALRVGLMRGVPGAVVSRNLVAFNTSPSPIRWRFVEAVEIMASTLVGRDRIGISLEAAVAASDLLWDAHLRVPYKFLRASSILLPYLMRATSEPVSPLIAATFPPVYHELHRARLPEFMSIVFIFFDWDKCKSARRTLIDAFLRSEWRATDIALAAVRAGDGTRILKRLARQHGGERAISAIERDMSSVPLPWRSQVKSALEELKSDQSPGYSDL